MIDLSLSGDSITFYGLMVSLLLVWISLEILFLLEGTAGLYRNLEVLKAPVEDY